jgi:cytoskeletal protein CcmA (bactofilin family)
MKKTLLISILILPVIFLFGLYKAVKAETNPASESITISKDQVISNNFVRVGNTFDIQGTVEGDVIVAGSSVNISGTVAGDVIAAAAIIKIDGEVKGNVRVAGMNVEINGKVGKNANLFGSSVIIGDKAEIGSNVGFVARSIEHKGKILGKFDGWASTATISGQILNGSNIKFNIDNEKEETLLFINSKAVIENGLTYNSTKEAQIETGAQIKGEVKHNLPVKALENIQHIFTQVWWFMKISSLFAILLIGMLIVYLFKKAAQDISDFMWHKSGRSIVYGILILILVPLSAFILLFTVIGIPLAIILVALYWILIYTTKVFVGVLIGRKILEYFKAKKSLDPKKKEISLMASMFLGTTLFVLVVDWLLGHHYSGATYFLNILGGAIRIFTMVWALGAIFEIIRQRKETKNEQ